MTARSNRKYSAQTLLLLVLRLRTFIVLFLLTGVFAYLSPVFLSPNNLVIMSKHVAINAVLAVGMTLVIVTGGIDLSVGSIVGLAGMIAGGLIAQGLVLRTFGVVIYFHAWVVVAIGLATGLLVGWVNGVLISRFNIAPFIATLGTMYAARGMALLRSNGQTFPNLAGNPALGNTGFELIGGGRLLGVPVPIWLMILFAGVAYLTMDRLPLGRQIYAVGGNARAAELSGIRVDRVRLVVYVISGLCAAMAGLIIAAELQSGHPASGTSFEMNAIAAVVLGGTSLAGGRGTIGGTIIGAFIIGFLSDGLVLLGVSSFWQMVIKGAVIVLAVLVDQAQEQLQKRQVLQRA